MSHLRTIRDHYTLELEALSEHEDSPARRYAALKVDEVTKITLRKFIG